MPTDLDQSGSSWHRIRSWLGPSLGWVETQSLPTLSITLAGTYSLPGGTGVVLVNVAAAVTLLLPNVVFWIKEPAYQPAAPFNRSIWIKDLGGNAATFPITITPFASQLIDGGGVLSLNVNHGIYRLYPLNDLSGWFLG
jgi:hypothetical protein